MSAALRRARSTCLPYRVSWTGLIISVALGGAAAGAGTCLSLSASRLFADARAAAAQALMAAKARYVMAQLQALGFEPWQTAAAVMRHGSDLEVRAPS